ncbi:MAG: PilZ domain-containing protein [Methylococcales bacterium]
MSRETTGGSYSSINERKNDSNVRFEFIMEVAAHQKRGFKMLEYGEKRAYLRRETGCNMTYKFPDSEREYQAICINLSGTGILFKARDDLEPGRALEIRIRPENYTCPSITAFIEIIRSDPIDADQYEIAASIKGIKAN